MINPEKPSRQKYPENADDQPRKTHPNKNPEKPKPPLPTAHQNPTGTKTHIKNK